MERHMVRIKENIGKFFANLFVVIGLEAHKVGKKLH